MEEKIILDNFINWVIKNYSHVKGGYRHKGDFYKNDKPVKLESLKDQYLNIIKNKILG